MNPPDTELTKVSRRKLLRLASYRVPMTVTEGQLRHGNIYYYCPRCRCPLDREYMAFCVRCGQKLSWRSRKKARIICSEPD